MSEESAFRRLIPEQVEGLFDEPAQSLRLNYIEVLTILQDILGRYSSAGNATVFNNSSEAESLVYASLGRIRTFVPERLEIGFDVPSFPSNKRDVRTKKTLTIEIKSWEPSEVGERVINIAAKLAEKGRTKVSRKKGVQVKYDSKTGFKFYAEETEPERKYEVSVVFDIFKKILWIYEQQFDVTRFTLEDFRKSLGLSGERDNSEEAYNELMKQIGPTRKRDAREEFLTELQKAVLYSASQNIALAMNLKQRCLGEKRIPENLLQSVDLFLTELLTEYQILRKSGQGRSVPPLVNQQPTPTSTKGTRSEIDSYQS